MVAQVKNRIIRANNRYINNNREIGLIHMAAKSWIRLVIIPVPLISSVVVLN